MDVENLIKVYLDELKKFIDEESLQTTNKN